MRFVLAVLMVMHGVAHLPGFVGSWQLAPLPGTPYRTTVLAGRLDVGDAGIRVIGALWLLAAVGFWIAALGAFTGRPWWMPVAMGVALVSLVLTVLGWPSSRIGVVVNLAILAVLVLGERVGARLT